MRRLFMLLIFLIASVWFGLTVVRHPGFVFISYQPWMVQMPLWLAALGLIVIFMSLYFIFNSVERVQFLWYRIKNWLKFRKANKLYSKTQRGLALLVEGRWSKAERFLMAGVNQSVEPLMNYLGAARAAQEQGAIKRRDTYLEKAYLVAPDAEIAIGITQAELLIEHTEFEQALAVLLHLHDLSRKHPRVLALMQRVYMHQRAWNKLLPLLPLLRKSGALNREQVDTLEKIIFCEMFRAANGDSREEVKALWDKVPRGLRKNPEVIYEYSKQLLRFNEADEAEVLIRKSLRSDWSAPLARLYGTLPFENLNRQLGIAGDWLQTYGPQPELYLTLGRLCARIKLWGKARDYFEKCLSLGPNPEASLEYARLLETIGKEQEAIEKYRDGLGAATAN